MFTNEEQASLLGLPLEERIIMLQDNAESRKEMEYYRDLTPEEVAERRQIFADLNIDFSKLKAELDEHKANYKAKMDPIKAQYDLLLDEIKFKKANCKGMVYNLANHDTGMMEVYEENGQLLETRRLKPEEKQARLYVQRGSSMS